MGYYFGLGGTQLVFYSKYTINTIHSISTCNINPKIQANEIPIQERF